MPSILGLCPTRRTSVFSWLFGSGSSSFASHSKLTVEVNTVDTHGRSRNRIVASSPYNLRPRRADLNYREAATDAEESDASET